MSVLIKGINKAQFYRDLWESNFRDPDWQICEIQDEGSEAIPEYDTEEIHENVTVQIWRNKRTGELSIGWWEN